MNEGRKFPRTTQDSIAEDLADMADEAGLWDEWQQPVAEPIKLNRLKVRRDIVRGQRAVDAFLEEANTFHEAMYKPPGSSFETPGPSTK